MILTFELTAEIMEHFQVKADSLEEAYEILGDQFLKVPLIPAHITGLSGVDILPIDIRSDENGFVPEETEKDFYDSDWTLPLFEAVDMIEAANDNTNDFRPVEDDESAHAGL